LRSLISPPDQNAINRESSETIWEEMLFLLREQSNLDLNFLLLMMCAGGTTAVGLWTNTLYIILAGQVLGLHYKPLVRIRFGLITGRPISAWRGLLASIAGFSMMAFGAALTLLVLRVVDPKYALDLDTRSWVHHFSSVTHSAVLLSAIAAAAGAVIIISQPLVLLTGVYIALALVPSMSLVGMGLASGDLPLARKGLVHWAVDVALVILIGAIVLGLKQALVHHRRTLS